MKNLISQFLIIISFLVLCGCAATYKNVNPPSINYSSHDLQDGISLSYRYDILREKGNTKYAKKEDNKGVKLIAIKLTNNTDSVINVNKDLVFYSGSNAVIPMDPLAIKNTIKQVVPGYLPYLLLSFVNLYVTKDNKTETYHIGLVLGPGITIGNMAVASTSNTNMLNELNEYNILYSDIKKGETLFGIIGLRDVGYNPISVKLKK